MRIHQYAVVVTALISLSLLSMNNSMYAHGAGGGGAGSSTSGSSTSGSGGPGSYTELPSTGNGNLKGIKAIAHLWHLLMKGPNTPPIASVAPVAPMVLGRVAKKAPANPVYTRLTALPSATPAPVAKIIQMAVPTPTPAPEGAELHVFWWPDPPGIVTGFRVTK
jgi:hypothetical protein